MVEIVANASHFKAGTEIHRHARALKMVDSAVCTPLTVDVSGTHSAHPVGVLLRRLLVAYRAAQAVCRQCP